jgi:Domain of unknown function (DUF4037)
LAQYPRLARLQRVSDELFKVWHFGQYNFLDRLLIRQDPLALQMAQGHFIEAAMRLCLLLEGDYTPYWKWLAFAFSKCPSAARLDHPLGQLSQSGDLKKRGELVREVCAVIHEMLKAAGLASQDLSIHPHPLFCDHVALANTSSTSRLWPGSSAINRPTRVLRLVVCLSNVGPYAAYSDDLCERVVAAIESGYTRKEVVELFNIPLSTVGGFIRRKRETGRSGGGTS